MSNLMIAHGVLAGLPKLVAEKRQLEGLTFVVAAWQIGISVSTIHRIEIDPSYNIGARTILRLLRWLEAPPNSLVRGIPIE